MRVRAVLFDLGDTLVDGKDFDGWTAAASLLYLDLDRVELRRTRTSK